MKNASFFTRSLWLGLMVTACVAYSAHAAEVNATSNLVDESGPAPGMPADVTTAPQFAKVIDDLPLMPGLHLKQDKDVLFLTSRERIAETEAEGPVDIDDVYRFYRETLPQMGWKKIDARHFSRENDVLRIDAKAEDKQTHVLFAITPGDK